MVQAKIQGLLEKSISRKEIFNIALGVQSKDKGVMFTGAVGTADLAGAVPMRADTPYLIASITKMYTASVIMRLHQQRQLSLDDLISKYLPASLIGGIHIYKGEDYGRHLKVHHLVDQTSGLADYFEDKPKGDRSLFDDLKQGQDRALDLQQMVDIVRTLSPSSEPGKKAHYSDTNYQLLGAIIESVTNKSVDENYQEMIFEPLDLQQTYLIGALSSVNAQAPATAYFKERPLTMPKFLAWSGPDGGIVSTLSESMIFLRAFFDGKLFDEKLFGRMMARWNEIFFPLHYGYGMMQFKLPRIFSPFRPTPELIGHSGATGSFAFYAPEKALYLVGTVNQIASPNRPFQLMLQVINALE